MKRTIIAVCVFIALLIPVAAQQKNKQKPSPVVQNDSPGAVAVVGNGNVVNGAVQQPLQAAPSPTATPAPATLQPLPLKPDHYTQLQLHDLNIARLEQALSAARTAKENDVLKMFVEVGGSAAYDQALNVLDQQRRTLGFLPKAVEQGKK